MPTPTYNSLATYTTTSGQSTVTFSSISGYTDLIIIAQLGLATASQDLLMRFNNDASAIYDWRAFYTTSSTPVSWGDASNSKFVLDSVGVGTTVANQRIIQIYDYANTNGFKNMNHQSSDMNKAIEYQSGTWRSTAAITSITLYPTNGNFTTGSVFTIYGILRA